MMSNFTLAADYWRKSPSFIAASVWAHKIHSMIGYSTQRATPSFLHGQFPRDFQHALPRKSIGCFLSRPFLRPRTPKALG